jgi:hypothetical protein
VDRVRVADRGALGDLEQQGLVDAERVVERRAQGPVDLLGRRRRRRGPRDVAQARRDRAGRWLAQDVRACRSGDRVGNGAASLKRGSRRLSAGGVVLLMRLTAQGAGSAAQQAPGFCAQKSSNCSASEPAGGAVSLAAESSVAGAVAPPLSVPVVPVAPPVPVAAPVSELALGVVPVAPDWSLGAASAPESAVGVGVGVALASPLDEEPLPAEPEGTGTSTGGPGTSW